MTAIFYLLTLVLPLTTILIVFGMRYYAAVQQARARLANDDAIANSRKAPRRLSRRSRPAWPPWSPTCRTCAPAWPPSRPS
jgi:hypothetical protein